MTPSPPLDAERYDLTYISLGAGVQSSALLVCSQLGLYDVPKADVAIFADTGDEPKAVYEHLERLKAWSTIPIQVVQWKVLSETILSGVFQSMAIPAFVSNDGKPGMLFRQCTDKYKVRPINKAVKASLGYQRGQRVNKRARALLGISIEEVHRMKPSCERWIENTYPLVDAGITRQKCLEIWRDYTSLPLPSRSACVYCPYHSDSEWRGLKQTAPEDFEKACQLDEAIRDSKTATIKHPVYLHRSLTPLRQVSFDGDGQGDLWGNECEGMCGV